MKDARLLHYSHCVSDLDRSRAFYVDVLGFRVAAEIEGGLVGAARAAGQLLVRAFSLPEAKV